jgi:hypothetical protein
MENQTILESSCSKSTKKIYVPCSLTAIDVEQLIGITRISVLVACQINQQAYCVCLQGGEMQEKVISERQQSYLLHIYQIYAYANNCQTLPLFASQHKR